MLDIPASVQTALSLLHAAGKEAFIVGGCVRDSLMNRVPGDWDIATSALPEQCRQVFSQYTVLDTGVKHGTVTVLLDGMALEITTYRIDGSYSDGRRPDFVSFTDNLREDLRRRDFTVNAMAYDPRIGVIDPFGGRADLEAAIIRCVGEPSERFGEDALRILRALRFSSVLGFAIEEETAAALNSDRLRLQQVSAERKAAELQKLLLGKDVGRVLSGFGQVMAAFIPEIEPLINFHQHSPFHHLDVWQHTAAAVSYVPARLDLRLALLMHDIAKPLCYVEREGIGHFPNHAAFGAVIADAVLDALRFDRDTCRTVHELVLRHEQEIIPERSQIKRLLSQLDEDGLRRLLQVQEANIRAQKPAYLSRLDPLKLAQALADDILESGECYRLSQLALRGDELLALGIKGPAVGRLLSKLLDAVIKGECPNDHEELLALAEELRE